MGNNKPGAGFPDVTGFKNSPLQRDWWRAAGGWGFGPQGQQYRAFLCTQTLALSQGQGMNFLAMTDGLGVTAASQSRGFPFLAAVAAAGNSTLFAGALAESRAANSSQPIPGVLWVQVGGPITVTLTLTNATSAAGAYLVPANSSAAWSSAAHATLARAANQFRSPAVILGASQATGAGTRTAAAFMLPGDIHAGFAD